LIYFLHDKGYNYFNIGKLTYAEINALIEIQNKEIREKNSQLKRAERMRKRARR